MGGRRVWTADHDRFCYEKFTTQQWWHEDAKVPSSRGKDRDPVKAWHEEVKDLAQWKPINLQIFRKNVKKRAEEWLLSPHNPDNVAPERKNPENNDGDDDDDDDDAEGGKTVFSGYEKCDGIINTSDFDGNTISLAYIQCKYDRSGVDIDTNKVPYCYPSCLGLVNCRSE